MLDERADLIEHEVMTNRRRYFILGGTRPSNSKSVRSPVIFVPSAMRAATVPARDARRKTSKTRPQVQSVTKRARIEMRGGRAVGEVFPEFRWRSTRATTSRNFWGNYETASSYRLRHPRPGRRPLP